MSRRKPAGQPAQFDDGYQAVLNAACKVCGAPAQVIVHLRDCRTAGERERRKSEALAELRCATCAGKDLMAKKKAESLEGAPAVNGIFRFHVDDIAPDPDQPRKHFDTSDIEATLEVKDGVAVDPQHDITHPIQIIRSERPPYRIKDGERRWRAAKNVGLLGLPAYFVDGTDRASILEEQLRAGITAHGLRPLEIADAIAVRIAMSKRNPPHAEDLAARMGLSSARQVNRYRQLSKLAPEVRKALDEGTIEMSVALEIATVSVELQEEALKNVGGLVLRQARQQIRSLYHLLLVDCGFDPADGTLPGGSCEACPKNTKAQRELWADGEDGEGRCTDKACFDEKREESWERRKAVAEAAGLKVIDGEAAKKLYPTAWGDCRDENLIELGHECYFDQAGATWLEVLNRLPSMLVRNEWNKVHELVTKAEAIDAARKAGREDIAELLEGEAEETERTATDEPATEARTDNEYRREIAAKQVRRAEALTRLLGSAMAAPLDARLLRFLCGMAIRADDTGDVLTEICDRRVIAQAEDPEELAKALLSFIAPIEDVGVLQALLIELLVYLAEHRGHAEGEHDPLPTACRFFGIEYGSVTPAAQDAAEASSEPAKHEEPALVTPAAPGLSKEPQIGICRVCGCTDAHACDSGCAWADPAETLCSICAGIMQDITDLLEQGSDTFEAIIEQLKGDTQRVQAAIEEMLRAGELASKNGVLLLPAPLECRICRCAHDGTFDEPTLCGSCKKLVEHIKKLCKDKPRQGAQIKAGSKQWGKDRVHDAIKVMTAEGLLDKDMSGFSTAIREAAP